MSLTQRPPSHRVAEAAEAADEVGEAARVEFGELLPRGRGHGVEQGVVVDAGHGEGLHQAGELPAGGEGGEEGEGGSVSG